MRLCGSTLIYAQKVLAARGCKAVIAARLRRVNDSDVTHMARGIIDALAHPALTLGIVLRWRGRKLATAVSLRVVVFSSRQEPITFIKPTTDRSVLKHGSTLMPLAYSI